MWRTRWRWTAVGLALIALGGCDDGGGAAPPVVVIGGDGAVDVMPDGIPDAMPDAMPDAAPPDAMPDAEAPDMAPFDDWPPPSADGVPVEVRVETWMRAMPPLPDDPLRGRYERGEIAWPREGEDADGVRWFALRADEAGEIGDFGFSDGYVVGRVPVTPGHAVLVRADRAARTSTARSVQPGDLYGEGTSLFPALAAPGAAEVVLAVEAFPRRGAPRIRVFTTPDRVVLNPADLTFPDLRVGQATAEWLGVPVLETRGEPLRDVRARVIESEHWRASEESHPGLPAGAATQVPFRLVPKAPWAEAEAEIPVTLEVASPDLDHAYRRTFTLTTRAAEGPYRQTFRSPIDGSVQYYGVRPPPAVDPDADYALVLSLHGAGVEAIGQVGAYAAKDWAYLVAPTNRRRFGFDWEEWGRFNALASLDDAMARFAIDPTRVYLTGHSMGGHGTWHVGVTTPGRFAVLGPSAGWASFETYVGLEIPDGLFGRARAHSRTLDYIENLARRAVYIIHGDADDNVPVREGRAMFEAVGAVTDDIAYHEQPGAGHWWSAGIGEGTDCVDWPPLFELMQQRRLDPFELDFDFRSPNPGYAPDHSVVRLEAAESPLADLRVSARRMDDRWVVTTENVRRMWLDGAALAEAGIAEVEVDGAARPVEAGPMAIGPETGKTAERSGPLNQAFRRPFCFVWPDADDPRADAWRRVAAYWASYWQLIGNGHACGLPAGDVGAATAAGYNAVRLGSAADGILPIDGIPITADVDGITLDGMPLPGTSLVMVHPDGDRLGALLTAAEGLEHLVMRLVPFSSTGGLPDFLIYADGGGRAAGFFDADWRWDPALVLP